MVISPAESGLYTVRDFERRRTICSDETGLHWFKRVVGVVSPAGSAQFIDSRINHGYERSDAKRFPVDVEPEILRGVASFMKRYMSEPGKRYNGQTFADWIANGPNAQTQFDADVEVYDTHHPSRHLNPGERGYYFGTAPHSVVGLTEDHVIHVMGTGGDMAILPHEDLLDIYGEPRVVYL